VPAELEQRDRTARLDLGEQRARPLVRRLGEAQVEARRPVGAAEHLPDLERTKELVRRRQARQLVRHEPAVPALAAVGAVQADAPARVREAGDRAALQVAVQVEEEVERLAGERGAPTRKRVQSGRARDDDDVVDRRDRLEDRPRLGMGEPREARAAGRTSRTSHASGIVATTSPMLPSRTIATRRAPASAAAIAATPGSAGRARSVRIVGVLLRPRRPETTTTRRRDGAAAVRHRRCRAPSCRDQAPRSARWRGTALTGGDA
jgi:hypothetical protein